MIAKPVIAIASMMTGGALMGLVAHWEKQDRTWNVTTSALLPESTPAVVRPQVPEPQNVEMIFEEPITVTATPKPARIQQKVTKRVDHTVLFADQPCSSWRDIGPQSTMGESGPAERRVRELCVRNSE